MQQTIVWFSWDWEVVESRLHHDESNKIESRIKWEWESSAKRRRMERFTLKRSMDEVDRAFKAHPQHQRANTTSPRVFTGRGRKWGMVGENVSGESLIFWTSLLTTTSAPPRTINTAMNARNTKSARTANKILVIAFERMFRSYHKNIKVTLVVLVSVAAIPGENWVTLDADWSTPPGKSYLSNGVWIVRVPLPISINQLHRMLNNYIQIKSIWLCSFNCGIDRLILKWLCLTINCVLPFQKSIIYASILFN